MAGGKLEVQIGADITEFEKKIKEIEFDIKELSKAKLDRLKLGLDTTEINAQIKDAKDNLNQLRTAVKDTGGTIGGQFKQQTANGSNALLQFSRIAQDAPFGIIGIGNNLTATAEAFGALKNQTGSTGGALKALASSITGTGGLLLGVSLLTTGFTLLAQSGLSVGDVIDKITGNFDEFGAALKKANEEAVKNSAGEISGLNALVATSQNVSLSIKDRKIAVEELQKTYPAYFGNLSQEQILNGNVKTAVEGVTNALIAKAKAQAFTKELVKLSEEQFKLEEQNLKLLQQKNDAEAKQANAVKNVIKANKSRGDAEAFTAVQTIANTEAINQKLAENEKQLKLNAEAQAKWTSRINENVAASIRLNQTNQAGRSQTSANTPQVAGIPNLATQGLANINNLGATIQASFKIIPETVSSELARVTAILFEFSNEVNDLIQNSIATTFADLGSVIGNALATGGDVLSAIGSGLIQSLGSFLSALGDKLITYGLLLAGFGKAELAFKVGDPVTKIGAGIAMVALGVAAKAAGAAVSAYGGGGLSGRGASGATGAGANNQSFTSSGFSSSAGGGTVVFEIAGTKLIGVLSNTINANRRLGGQLGIG